MEDKVAKEQVEQEQVQVQVEDDGVEQGALFRFLGRLCSRQWHRSICRLRQSLQLHYENGEQLKHSPHMNDDDRSIKSSSRSLISELNIF